MSLVNQNWIGLHGEPVTGRIPPRMLVMNGVQPNPQQMGMIAHHYKLLTYMMKVSVIPFLIQERTLTDGTRIRMVSSYGTDTVMVWPTGGSDSFSMGTLFVVRPVHNGSHSVPDGFGIYGWSPAGGVTYAQQVGEEYDEEIPTNPKLINGAYTLKIRTDEKTKKKKPFIVRSGGTVGLGMMGSSWKSHIHYASGVTLIGPHVFVGHDLCATLGDWYDDILAVSRVGRSTIFVANAVGVFKWKLPTNPDGSLVIITDKDFVELSEKGEPLPLAKKDPAPIIDFVEVLPDTINVTKVQFGVGGNIAWAVSRRPPAGVFEAVDLVSGVITPVPNEKDKYFLDKRITTPLSRASSSSGGSTPYPLPQTGVGTYTLGTIRYKETVIGGRYVTNRADLGEFRDLAIANIWSMEAPPPSPEPSLSYASYSVDSIVVSIPLGFGSSAYSQAYQADRWAVLRGDGQVFSGSASASESFSSGSYVEPTYEINAWFIDLHTGAAPAQQMSLGVTFKNTVNSTTSTTSSTDVTGIPLRYTSTLSLRETRRRDDLAPMIGSTLFDKEATHEFISSVPFSEEPTEQIRAERSFTKEIALTSDFIDHRGVRTQDQVLNASGEYLCYLNLDTGWAITQTIEFSRYVSIDTERNPDGSTFDRGYTKTTTTYAKKIQGKEITTHEVNRSVISSSAYSLVEHKYGVPIEPVNGSGGQLIHDRFFSQHESGGSGLRQNVLYAAVSSRECLMLSFVPDMTGTGVSQGAYQIQASSQLVGSGRAAAFAVCDDGTVTDLHDVISIPSQAEVPATAFEMTLLREKI